MHNTLIQDFAYILLAGSLFGWLFKRFFNLPLILGYILGGLFLNILVIYNFIKLMPETVYSMAELGVLLLIFSMGLHFSLPKLKALGMKPIIVSVAQALLMWFTGVKIGQFFGFTEIQAQFLGAAITTASTAMIVKVLDEYQLKNARFVEKLFGVLLVEDSVVIFIIIWLSAKDSTLSAISQNNFILNLVPIFLGSVLLWWVLGTILVPRFIKAAFHYGREELLVVLAVGFALALAQLSNSRGFSPALGAFIMGSIMSECRELKKIETLIEPLKNFFALIFFVSVGLLFAPSVFLSDWKLIVTMIVCVICCKFVYNVVLNTLSGVYLKDSIRMAGAMLQIGEMSLVVAQTGRYFGIFDEKIFSVIIAVAVVTMITTPITTKFFLNIGDKVDHLLPNRFIAGLDSYAQAMTDFSFYDRISAHHSKFYFFREIRYVMSTLLGKIQKNYSRLTSRNQTSTFSRLAPWDEYLVPFHIPPASIVSGKTLFDLKLREKFGTNVVAIERENRFIVAPMPKDLILGSDTLIIYGTEESVSKLTAFCEQIVDPSMFRTIDDCALGTIYVTPGHIFIGKSILDLEIRAIYNCVILAVNRGNERIKNPQSRFIFDEGDEIFIFGTKNSISNLIQLSENG